MDLPQFWTFLLRRRKDERRGYLWGEEGGRRDEQRKSSGIFHTRQSSLGTERKYKEVLNVDSQALKVWLTSVTEPWPFITHTTNLNKPEQRHTRVLPVGCFL